MKLGGLAFVFLLLISLTVPGCAQPTPIEEVAPPETGNSPAPQGTASPEAGNISFTLTSTAFADGENIPVKYTCKGENRSPELSWTGIPDGTVSLALTLDDPDATVGTFTHWVVFNLPKDSTGLPEGVTKDTVLVGGALQGNNGARRLGYIGPCPPIGDPHHYTFTLYALDTTLALQAGATKDQVLQAMQGHVLGQARLIGLYQNKGY